MWFVRECAGLGHRRRLGLLLGHGLLLTGLRTWALPLGLLVLRCEKAVLLRPLRQRLAYNAGE